MELWLGSGDSLEGVTVMSQLYTGKKTSFFQKYTRATRVEARMPGVCSTIAHGRGGESW